MIHSPNAEVELKNDRGKIVIVKLKNILKNIVPLIFLEYESIQIKQHFILDIVLKVLLEEDLFLFIIQKDQNLSCIY